MTSAVDAPSHPNQQTGQLLQLYSRVCIYMCVCVYLYVFVWFCMCSCDMYMHVACLNTMFMLVRRYAGRNIIARYRARLRSRRRRLPVVAAAEVSWSPYLPREEALMLPEATALLTSQGTARQL